MENVGPEVSLILPAYNERNTIANTIEQAEEYFERRHLSHEIIVAADGNDGTRELVREMARSIPNLRVLGSMERRGKGHGIRQAVRIAQGSIIGFTDADNKTPISEFDKIYPLFEEGWELVIGSRGLDQSIIERKQPFYRQLGSRCFWLVLRAIVGLYGIPDTQCGFKFFTWAVAKDLFRRQKIDSYMFDVEILHLAHRCQYRIKSVPIRWRDDGDSRLELFGGNIRNLLDLLRIRSMHWREPRSRSEGTDLLSMLSPPVSIPEGRPESSKAA